MSTQHDTELVEDSDTQVFYPRQYHVLLLNDDYTPMDFVVQVLREVFHHSLAAATRLMMQVHQAGRAIVGTYTAEIAETKVAEVSERAETAGYPLLCIAEPAE